jgi:hypothetical protein
MTEAKYHVSASEFWLITGVGALWAILIAATAIAVIVGTVAAIRYLLKSFANALRWLVSKSLQGLRAASK